MTKTPEQEADELVEMFEEMLNHIRMGSNGIEDMLHELAINATLIHVERLIEVLKTSPFNGFKLSCNLHYEQVLTVLKNKK